MSEELIPKYVEGWYNLAVGEPVFLQEVFKPECVISPPVSGTYPGLGGEKHMIEAVKTHLYTELGLTNQYVVIANGAKQALLASFYALAQTENKKVVCVDSAPYWPSYPELAKLSGLDFSPSYNGFEWEIHCITSPNNPDGMEMDGPCDIWDAVYAYPLYNALEQPKSRIRVAGAAKLFGVSGWRVGWLSTSEEKLAQVAAHYVEATTSGVCKITQEMVANALDNMYDDDIQEMFLDAGAALLQNSIAFHELIEPCCEVVSGCHRLIEPCGEIVPECPGRGRGMFAWFKVKPDLQEKFAQALEKAKVKLVPGERCGMTEPGWYRMSLGHNVEHTRKALEAISKEMQ